MVKAGAVASNMSKNLKWLERENWRIKSEKRKTDAGTQKNEERRGTVAGGKKRKARKQPVETTKIVDVRVQRQTARHSARVRAQWDDPNLSTRYQQGVEKVRAWVVEVAVRRTQTRQVSKMVT